LSDFQSDWKQSVRFSAQRLNYTQQKQLNDAVKL
jgi:hypothetical protein